MELDKETAAKYTLKDSVFTNLFRIPEYTLALYRALHPEDTTATEEDIDIVTLENIFLDQPYNDLGFTVKDRLLILVEAQSTWTMNIIVRMLLYAAQTIQNHINEKKLDVYGSKKIPLYKPEFYVLYLGDRKEKPDIISLREEFFPNQPCDLDVTVHMLYDGMQGDIINQYVTFTKVYMDQVALYGRKKTAVTETIRICKDRDVLRQYLLSREKEVVDIMTTLFDQERVFDIYVHNRVKDAREEGIVQGMAQGMTQGMEQGIAQGITEGKAQTLHNVREKLAQSGMSPAAIDAVLEGL